ncbi:Uncharacterised protein [Mycolicibacterium flavescens]|nr:hypothetical protein [Mycobacterium neumannii]VEG39403.1 Uncharacterised protein [Mycolicibacterium flavescens]
MSRYDELTDEERDYIKRAVADAPPLSDHQRVVIRAAFADVARPRRGR